MTAVRETEDKVATALECRLCRVVKEARMSVRQRMTHALLSQAIRSARWLLSSAPQFIIAVSRNSCH